MKRSLFLLLPLVFFLAPQVHATAYVQAKSMECSGSTSACVTTFDSNIAAGDGIIGGCNTYANNDVAGQSFSSVMDSAGSTYTLGTLVNSTGSSEGVALQPAYTLAAGSGGGKTVTANYSPAWNPSGGGFVMCAWEEISSPPPFLDVTDTGVFATYGNVNPKTAAFTTSHANEWLVGIETQWQGNASCAGASDGQSGTFTERAQNNWIMVMDIAEATAASYSANTTSCSPSAGPWVLYVLAFAASGPPPCGTAPGAYFVQCESAVLPYPTGLVLSKAFDNPSVAGHTVVAGFNVIQSLGNSGNNATVTDTDGNLYTKEIQEEGGSGNSTLLVFDTKATTNHTLTVTVTITAGSMAAADKGINLTIGEYKNLSTPQTAACFSNNSGCTTSPTLNVGANGFYYAIGAFQGLGGCDSSCVIGPSGYTTRASATASQNFLVSTFDHFIAAAQSAYAVFLDTDDGANAGAFYGALLAYGTVIPSTRRKSQVY